MDTGATLPTAAAAAAPADADPVDPQRVAEERTAFLDSLITSDTRVADFRAGVAAMEASELPRLHYLHTLLPHVPWRFRPDGSTYADIDLPGYFSRWDEVLVKAHFGQQRHLLQLGLADRLLGEYLDRLEAIGDFDRATVIVAADHGISFVPGERSRGIGEANVAGIATAPLLYKEPGQRTGTLQHQPVQLIDAPAGAGIAVALSINGVVAATARSYREGSLHRVYIIGDPQFWQAREPDVELHEIVGGRLARVLHC